MTEKVLNNRKNGMAMLLLLALLYLGALALVVLGAAGGGWMLAPMVLGILWLRFGLVFFPDLGGDASGDFHNLVIRLREEIPGLEIVRERFLAQESAV